ncbi:TPA: hypothetical protein ACI7ND_004134, partial [Escherichia coli]
IVEKKQHVMQISPQDAKYSRQSTILPLIITKGIRTSAYHAFDYKNKTKMRYRVGSLAAATCHGLRLPL